MPLIDRHTYYYIITGKHPLLAHAGVVDIEKGIVGSDGGPQFGTAYI